MGRVKPAVLFYSIRLNVRPSLKPEKRCGPSQSHTVQYYEPKKVATFIRIFKLRTWPSTKIFQVAMWIAHNNTISLLKFEKLKYIKDSRPNVSKLVVCQLVTSEKDLFTKF